MILLKNTLQLILLTTIFITQSAVAASTNFEKIFTDWTNAFNQKNLTASCALFAKNIVADYQGVSQKNYTDICDGFKKVFNQKDTVYKYDFKLRHVYQENSLAAVRITWFLHVFQNGKQTSFTQDEGIDIFVKSKEGRWEIVNYIGYPIQDRIA